jgi:hypothetical protein
MLRKVAAIVSGERELGEIGLRAGFQQLRVTLLQRRARQLGDHRRCRALNTYFSVRLKQRLSPRVLAVSARHPTASALARTDPPPLARKGPRQDRRSDDSGGLGRRRQRQAQVRLDVVARGKPPTTGGAKRGRGRGKSAGDGSREGARDRRALSDAQNGIGPSGPGSTTSAIR